MHQSVELCAAGEPSSARSARPSRSTSSSPRAGRTTSAPSATPASSPSAPRLRSKAVTLFRSPSLSVLEAASAGAFLPSDSDWDLRELPIFVGLGVVGGLVGAAFVSLSRRPPSPFPPTPAPPAALSRRREGLREREREREREGGLSSRRLTVWRLRAVVTARWLLPRARGPRTLSAVETRGLPLRRRTDRPLVAPLPLLRRRVCEVLAVTLLTTFFAFSLPLLLPCADHFATRNSTSHSEAPWRPEAPFEEPTPRSPLHSRTRGPGQALAPNLAPGAKPARPRPR